MVVLAVLRLPLRLISRLCAWWLRIDLKTAELLRRHDRGALPPPQQHDVRQEPSNSTPRHQANMNGGAPAGPHANHVADQDENASSSNRQTPGHLVYDKYASQRQAWCDSIRDQTLAWNFNAFELYSRTHGNPLVTITVTLLETYELLDGWLLDRAKVVNFLLRVEQEYNPNSYHNNTHAADVTQTAAVILESFKKQVKEIPKLEYFSIIIASAVHDLGHLGVNNDFLINSRHPRATMYNDKSINENFHIARAFAIARESPDLDIFSGFNVDDQKQIRKLMIETVLSTDMAVHFDLLNRFTTQVDAKPDLSEWTDRTLLYQMLVHLADIANPSRPFHLARGWAERVIEEFCDQGDREAAIGLPVSAMCNRTTMNMPRAQLGFINIFLKPTLTCFERAAPDFVRMALEHLELTIREWSALDAAGLVLPPHLMPKPAQQQDGAGGQGQQQQQPAQGQGQQQRAPVPPRPQAPTPREDRQLPLRTP
ncbi:3'5'-cyclic nucleotide phosphodiesterase [Volvox carteri f. nagariensis]|uniref:Phosphodiesterase n=1 Tax=Volvox carteri f. nagariensis TaxID=3068 RepID=D8TN75_VOLCA|nr:3'5'-cyclic nucleotide phosphodiesterase [Volvox carteri f. nagariensis]EFJ51091.1 3'5'-cyclic nucleotide phosphodiesterase [Volvox carteri f. nagariensis]|eukprot:XP_002948103.1 3'5'-cyclic nucleotide phosphodiesterase [Volvox carteri f. nagariensis]